MLNSINIMGRLVKDPDLRHANETPVCLIRIACDRDYKNANGEKEADFFDVVSWRKLAEIVSQYAAKGRMVSVNGRLQTRTWNDRDGNKRYATEIVADRVYFCDPKPKEQGAQNSGAASNGGYGQASANGGGYGTSGGYGGGYGRNGYGQSPANGGRNAANNGRAQPSDNGNSGYGNGGAPGYGASAAGYAGNANGYGAADAYAAPPDGFVPDFNEDGDPF